MCVCVCVRARVRFVGQVRWEAQERESVIAQRAHHPRNTNALGPVLQRRGVEERQRRRHRLLAAEIALSDQVDRNAGPWQKRQDLRRLATIASAPHHHEKVWRESIKRGINSSNGHHVGLAEHEARLASNGQLETSLPVWPHSFHFYTTPSHPSHHLCAHGPVPSSAEAQAASTCTR